MQFTIFSLSLLILKSEGWTLCCGAYWSQWRSKGYRCLARGRHAVDFYWTQDPFFSQFQNLDEGRNTCSSVIVFFSPHKQRYHSKADAFHQANLWQIISLRPYRLHHSHFIFPNYLFSSRHCINLCKEQLLDYQIFVCYSID